jgi:hypothetical protein
MSDPGPEKIKTDDCDDVENAEDLRRRLAKGAY